MYKKKYLIKFQIFYLPIFKCVEGHCGLDWSIKNYYKFKNILFNQP